ncbi:MAG TPA: PD-(D/E)XK nuclease family protein [Steroidobacteraceae bacterium]|nr:PD-(D/E)XK nuclease family protein [Steroidobacteraceae bacterium]
MLEISDYIGSLLERGGTVVLPSRQRSYALRLAYAGAQLAARRRVWASPDALPLEGWLIREIERRVGQSANDSANGRASGRVPRLLSPAEEWLLWRQCTAEATHALELVNGAALAEALRRAGSLAAELGIDPQASRESVASETGLMAAVHRAVSERCQALGAAPLAMALRSLPSVGDERPVLFAGFLLPSPRLRALVTARAQCGYESAFPPPDPSKAVPPRIVRPADEHEELERIAEWCRQHLTARPDARLLVLLPGSAGRRERLGTLIGQSLAPQDSALVALEGGQPLASLPMVSHALASLALLSGAAVGVERLLEWLRSPWWSDPSAAARARLDLWLRERRRLQLDLASLLALLQRSPAPLAEPSRLLTLRLERAMASLRAHSGTLREWSERFKAALDVLGWPGNQTRDSSEQQTLLRFHELLDELGQLSAAVAMLPRAVAVQWLTELASRTAYRPADEDAPVTLAGAYLDPVVRYDGLWVAGLDAESLPQPVAPEPFLPLHAQIAAGSPAATAAGRLQEARALLAAWRAAAAECVLSAPSRLEGIERLPSPLLEEWPAAVQPAAEPRATIWLAARLHRPGLLIEWRDEAGVGWNPELPLPSGTRSLELQNLCPFRAYAELRLGSLELGVPEPGIAPDVRGQLLHAALQGLWERLGDSRALAALSAPVLDEWVAACVEGAAAALHLAEEESIAAPALARECRRTVRLIGRLLDIERRRPPFRVQHTEYSTRLRLAGQELRLRIDRLDALESGGLAILDYKSGRRVSPEWYGDRPSHPQLLAYLAAIGEDVVAMATVNVTAREVRFDGVAASEQLLPRVAGVKAPQGESRDPWLLRVAAWRGVIERLAAAFASGHAVVDPRPRACDFCHVASLCRVGDGLIASDEETPPEEAFGLDDE